MNTRFIFTPRPARRLALLALLSIGIASCDVTDVSPQDALPESSAFEDAAKANLSVAGMYDAAQSGFYDPLNGTAIAVRGYPFGAAANELGDIRGADVTDLAGFFGIVYQNNVTASSPNIVNMWSTLYSLINQANVVIEGVQGAGQRGALTPADAAAFEGEARFLRALAYHELLQHFARPFADGAGSKPGVPYRDFAINTIETVDKARSQGRNTVAEVYAKMLEDLKFSEDNLPATRSGSATVTRATKAAAIALKQRIHLHMGNWAAVVTEGNKLISAAAPFTSPIGGRALATTPGAAFPGGIAVTTENIFSIENSSDDNPGVNGALPSIYGSPNPPSNALPGVQGRGLIAISPNLFNASFWTCSDLRRTQLLQNTTARYFSSKYKDAPNNSDFAPIIRYAEVLLNQAEAESRLGNSVRALALLNAVRNRAVVNAADQFSVANGNVPAGISLTRAILNERRIEFVAEGFRWDDIHRLALDPNFGTNGIPSKLTATQTVLANYKCPTPGNPAPTLNGGFAAIAYDDFRFLWPIPSIEVANNPTLRSQQNPGY
ncbi:RagB/SusD family nutrient uptake outer membrane protein [Hymenobacter lapidiphilus]|uniref:RagB/SusD family nutrient uptake outer membrane protein n=1 Tax=Hymenobacter sp. CCM 8763 TaxID=2303334 RepID=UPI000E34F55A|nr:RagB/SusD family nutrient uptake outer membrane protein [Hymenobacter sp. CCM 8763]RFP65290.1 RagB/SusD family nutrient uptake outer membrane protein [Hymenobacter sp. CCM 8763]